MLRFRPLLPVLLTAISVSACGGSDEKRPALPVQQASVLEAPFTDDIDTVSTLEANTLVELAAQTSGRVTELKVSQGDRIDAGQLLVVFCIVGSVFICLHLFRMRHRDWSIFISGGAFGLSLMLMYETKFW